MFPLVTHTPTTAATMKFTQDFVRKQVQVYEMTEGTFKEQDILALASVYGRVSS